MLSKLTPTWPQLTPSWLLSQAMLYALVKDSPHQIWWHRALLSKLTPTWPQLTPTWPLTPAMLYALVRDSSHQFVGHRAFPSNLTPGWHQMTLHDLWPKQCKTLWPKALLTKFGSHRAFLRQIDSWMTFDPRWGRFENMPTNLVGPSTTPMPTFSSIPQSMTKCIAGHAYIHIHTSRLFYFSSIDVLLATQYVLFPADK